jgi:hypothetical protein
VRVKPPTSPSDHAASVSQPFDEAALIDELIRPPLGYLGIEEPRGRAARSRPQTT